MKKLVAVVGLALVTSPVFADVYVGGKVGKSTLEDACRPTDACDDDATGGGLFLGYDINDYIAIEGGYDYFGKMTGAGLNDDSVSAVTIAPKFSYAFNDSVSAYTKIGGAYVDYGSEQDGSFLGAVGLEFGQKQPLSFRVEYQTLTDVNNDLVKAQANMVSLGISYKFGASSEDTVSSMPEPIVEPQPVVAQEPVVEEPAPEPETTVVIEQPTVMKTVTKQLSDANYFESDSSALSAQGKSELVEFIQTLTTYPQSTVKIIGHTDSTGSESYNLTLSKARAQSVADVFLDAGIDSSRMSVEGVGEAEPIASNQTAEGREKNRRVEVEIPEFEYQIEE